MRWATEDRRYTSPQPQGSSAPADLSGFRVHTPGLRAITLRFVDPELERVFQQSYLRDNLAYIRIAHVLGAVTWALFALLAQMVVTEGDQWDLLLRFGVAIPLTLVSLALTYTRWFRRHWQQQLAVVLLLSAVVWSTQRAVVEDTRPDWGYAGLMLILAFNYILTRIQFVTSAVVGALMIAYHNVIAIAFTDERALDIVFANYFLVVFAAMGMAAAYGLERFTRLLFLRERELERERMRADRLLRNILPRAIVDRLTARDEAPAGQHIADGFDAVTVLFAAMVGFTEKASRISPGQLVEELDEVFTRFDALADRVGMEKIKTLGDAYMAVAGAPQPREDHAEAAAEMALGISESLRDVRWPTGEPMEVRIGIATGPAVAGVIGRRKFAYDLWGDTVNVASRLQANARPGGILISEQAADLLDGRFALGEPGVVELRGKGPTHARYLLGRAAEQPSAASSAD